MNPPIDWKAIAKARGIETPDLDLIVGRQQAVERIFRAATRQLTPAQEPAAVFRAGPEEE